MRTKGLGSSDQEGDRVRNGTLIILFEVASIEAKLACNRINNEATKKKGQLSAAVFTTTSKGTNQDMLGKGFHLQWLGRSAVELVLGQPRLVILPRLRVSWFSA